MMADSDLYNLILRCKNNDNQSFEDIIVKFNPLLRKYSWLLHYDDAYEDLLYCFILCMYKMPIKELTFRNNDGKILSYIKTTIKNEYIHLSKKNEQAAKYQCDYEEAVEQIPAYSSNIEIQEQMFLADMRRYLNENEMELLYMKFCLVYSDKEIAEKYHISRQMVNKKLNKMKAKLKKLYELEVI